MSTMPGDDSRNKPSDSKPLVGDAAEDTGLDLFAEPGGNLFGEDSTPSLLLIEPVDDNENSTPSLRGSDTPLDPDSIALFGK